MLKGDVENQILAILFAAREPVTLKELLEVFEGCSREVLEARIAGLIEEFNGLQQAVEVRAVAGGYLMTTRVENHETIRRYMRTKPSAKLSQAALETLAVIAYKQPITLPEILEIRGVKGSSAVKTLLEKKLIGIRGKKKVVGRPILYGTTNEFLIHFGLDDLSDLPSLEEFQELLATEALDINRDSPGPTDESAQG